MNGSNLGIYGKKNKLKSKKAKADLEQFFNNLVAEIITSCKTDKKDDW